MQTPLETVPQGSPEPGAAPSNILERCSPARIARGAVIAPQLAPVPSPTAALPKRRGKRVYKIVSNAPSQEFKDLKDRHIEWMRATRYAENSVKGAHSDIEQFFKFLKEDNIVRIADVTTELLNRYSLALHNAAARKEGNYVNLGNAAHLLAGLKRFFRWAAQSMIILVDPAESLERPKLAQSLPRGILTQKEARRLLDAPDLQSPVGYRDKALLEVIYSTGIRSGELLMLKVGDFDAKQRTLFVRQGKGNKDRVLPLPALSAGYLAEYVMKIRPKFAKRRAGRGDDGTMFVNYTGSYCDNGDLKTIFTRAKVGAALDKTVTPMTLRHSIASHLLENGMDVTYIKEFLGHEKLSTTQLYAKVTLTGLRKHYNRTHPKEKRERRGAGRGEQP